jgi:isopenicillin N synthase-like dioxygenase
MASVENFPDIPPFPDDITTAPLIRLSLEKLLNHDKEELERFSKTCEEIGFFYLDLRHADQGESILADAYQLFKVGEDLFSLDLDEKVKYDFSKKNSYFGYKGQGAGVVDRQGNLDRHEFYNVCFRLRLP